MFTFVVEGLHDVLVGSRKLMLDSNIAVPVNVETELMELERDAQTAVILAIDGERKSRFRLTVALLNLF